MASHRIQGWSLGFDNVWITYFQAAARLIREKLFAILAGELVSSFPMPLFFIISGYWDQIVTRVASHDV
jgi:hypothetical protein